MINVATGLVGAALMAIGCSWDYPVWPKSKKSDTPLFRFVIRERNGAGYIDRQGKVIIQPAFDSSGNYGDDDFFDGLARVRISGESWYVGADGKPRFKARGCGAFSEGLAPCVTDRNAGFIDRSGKLVIPYVFDSVGAFSEGLAVVARNGGYGYVKKDGSFAIGLRYLFAAAWSDGVARVIEYGPCRYAGYGPCDAFNPITLPWIPGDSSERDPVPPKCLYSFIDKSGARLFDTRFPNAKDFSEGLAPVGNDTSWGYIDRNRNVAIPLQFEDAEPFSEGLAAVRKGGKWGYVDNHGRMIIAPQFSFARPFSEGMALVGDGPDYCFIDRYGHQPFPHCYTGASSFVMGLAHVRSGGSYYEAKWSYIDRNGHAVFTYSDQSNRSPGQQ